MLIFKDVQGRVHEFDENISASKLEKYVAERGLIAINKDEKELLLAPTQAELEAQFRTERDGLLQATDHIMTVDYYNSLSSTQAMEITEYRQALRDATETWILPDKPEWIK